MHKAKYIVQSHCDFTQEPLGSVFHYQTFSSDGLQVGTFTGTPAAAAEYAKIESLEAISPARLFQIWREKQEGWKCMMI